MTERPIDAHDEQLLAVLMAERYDLAALEAERITRPPPYALPARPRPRERRRRKTDYEHGDDL